MPALTLATMARPCVPAQMATTPCRRASAWHSNARLAAAAPRRQRAARGLRPRMAQEDGAATATEGKQRLSYQHLMVTLFDSNPYLAEGSRQALKTAAGLAAWESRLLVTDSMTVSLALGMGLVAEALPPSAVARHSGARTSPYSQRAIHIGPTVEAELS